MAWLGRTGTGRAPRRSVGGEGQNSLRDALRARGGARPTQAPTDVEDNEEPQERGSLDWLNLNAFAPSAMKDAIERLRRGGEGDESSLSFSPPKRNQETAAKAGQVGGRKHLRASLGARGGVIRAPPPSAEASSDAAEGSADKPVTTPDEENTETGRGVTKSASASPLPSVDEDDEERRADVTEAQEPNSPSEPSETIAVEPTEAEMAVNEAATETTEAVKSGAEAAEAETAEAVQSGAEAAEAETAEAETAEAETAEAETAEAETAAEEAEEAEAEEAEEAEAEAADAETKATDDADKEPVAHNSRPTGTVKESECKDEDFQDGDQAEKEDGLLAASESATNGVAEKQASKVQQTELAAVMKTASRVLHKEAPQPLLPSPLMAAAASAHTTWAASTTEKMDEEMEDREADRPSGPPLLAPAPPTRRPDKTTKEVGKLRELKEFWGTKSSKGFAGPELGGTRLSKNEAQASLQRLLAAGADFDEVRRLRKLIAELD